jgi:cold shock CspA family protein
VCGKRRTFISFSSVRILIRRPISVASMASSDAPVMGVPMLAPTMVPMTMAAPMTPMVMTALGNDSGVAKKREGPGGKGAGGKKDKKGKGKGKTPWRQWDGPMGGGGFRLNVKNLTPATSTGDQLRAVFAPFGTVIDAQVKKREDGTSYGFGYIVFATEQEGLAAQAAMNGRELNGKPLKVVPAERRQDMEDAGKGKGANTFGAPSMDPMALAMFQSMQMQQAMMQATLLNPNLVLPGTGVLPGGVPGSLPTGLPAGLPGVVPGLPTLGAPLPGLNPLMFGAGVPGMPGMPAGLDGTFEGMLKSISDKNGYGFIQCAETYTAHKRDVYVDKEALPTGAKVGDVLRFTVDMNEKGQPKALNVMVA